MNSYIKLESEIIRIFARIYLYCMCMYSVHKCAEPWASPGFRFGGSGHPPKILLNKDF